MATTQINVTIAEWFQNKSSWTLMKWWKTNFNMPVPDIFDDASVFTQEDGMLDPINPSTTYNLDTTNWGRELFAGNSVFVITWPFDWWDVSITQRRLDTDDNLMFENWPYTRTVPSLSSWQWQAWQLVSNQGKAPREINQDWTYKLVSEISWSGLSDSNTTNITISWVSTFPWYVNPWYLWVEWTRLCYTSTNGFVHKINWTYISTPVSANPWYIFEQDVAPRFTRYIDANWDLRRTPRQIEQFASIFSNWPTKSVSGASPWYMRMDNEFWRTHIWKIANDGKKYLIWDGLFPY